MKSYLSTLGVSSMIQSSTRKTRESLDKAASFGALATPSTVADEKQIANQAFKFFICNLDSEELYHDMSEQLGCEALNYMHLYAHALNKIDGLDLHLDSFSKNVVSVIPHSSEFSPELTFIFDDSSEITYFVTRKLICHGNTSNIHYYLVDEDYKKTIDTELSPIQKHIIELINKLYIWFLAKKHLLS